MSPGSADRARGGGKHLKIRYDHDRVTRRREDETGESLKWHGLVSGEVTEIGARSNKDGVDAGALSRRLDGTQSHTEYGLVGVMAHSYTVSHERTLTS